MKRHLELTLQLADIRDVDVDVVALKYAQMFGAADQSVTSALVDAGQRWDELQPRPGQSVLVPTRGAIQGRHALFVGMPELSSLGYVDIDHLSKQVLRILQRDLPTTRSLAMTTHGPGFGLSEDRAFKHQCKALVKEVRSNNMPSALESITIVDRNAGVPARFQDYLDDLLGKALWATRRADGTGYRIALQAGEGLASSDPRTGVTSRAAPPEPVIFQIVPGDVLSMAADVVALKYAHGFYGVTKQIARRLHTAGIVELDQLTPQSGDHRYVCSKGAIGPRNALILGVPPSSVLNYSDIREFGLNVMRALELRDPRAEHLVMTIHGPGFGMNPSQSFVAQCEGILEAGFAGHVPPGLRRISLVEGSSNLIPELGEAFERYVFPGVSCNKLPGEWTYQIPVFWEPVPSGEHSRVFLRLEDTASVPAATEATSVREAEPKEPGPQLTPEQARAEATTRENEPRANYLEANGQQNETRESGPPAESEPTGASSHAGGHEHVFVAMPFREDKEDLYHFAIRSPVEEEGLQCERTDKKAFVGDVLTRIKMKIGTASLVVGEISQTNPNVYLEVGYAWAQGRKTVLIAEQGTELPPVVKERECFLYPRLVDAGAFMRQTLRLRNVGVHGRLRVARTPPRPEPSTVFVLLPDTNRAADVYHFGIRQPLRTAGLIPQHIEEESRSSGYLALLTDFIDRSVVVIADLSGADATVYLAVGYAWGRNRPTILLIQEGEEPAYDVRGHKCLRYRTIHHLSEILTAELTDLKEQGIFSQG